MARSIVIADGEASSRELLAKLLKVMGYVKVSQASDGFDALRKIMEQEPDIVFVDTALPGIDGFLLCEMLHGVGKFRDMSIGLMGQHMEQREVQRGLKVGAYAFLEKPVTPESVKRALGNSASAEVVSSEPLLAKDESLLKQIAESAKRVFSLVLMDQAKILGIEHVAQEEKDPVDFIGIIKSQGDISFQIALPGNENLLSKVADGLGIPEGSATSSLALEKMLVMIAENLGKQLKNNSTMNVGPVKVLSHSRFSFERPYHNLFKIHLGVMTHGTIVRKQYKLPVWVAL